MRHHRLAASMTAISFAVIAVIGVVVLPAAAVAAPKIPALATVSSSVGLDSAGNGILIVSGTLPSKVSLPAKMVLAVPKGLTPSWIGEIVGTDPSKDPTAKYSVVPGKKYDTLTIDMVFSRKGQAEFSAPLKAVSGGTLYSLSLPILSRVGVADLSFRIPTGSKVASVAKGVTLSQSAGGIDLYSITKTSPRVGSTVSGSLTVVSSSKPAAAAAATTLLQSSTPTGSAGAGSSISQMIALLAAALAGFGVVTFVAYLKDRRVAQE
jgi:hypothetical protein